MTWLFSGSLRHGRFGGRFAGLWFCRTFFSLRSLCLGLLTRDGLLWFWRRFGFARRLRFCRLRLLFLMRLLLFVLLGDHARGQCERTANQYGYNFFHVTPFVGFRLLFIRIPCVY